METCNLIRLLIVQRSKFLRDALADGLSNFAWLDVVHKTAVSDPCALHEQIQRYQVDVVLLHVDSDTLATTQCVRALKRLYHEARVIVTGLANNNSDIVSVIEAGASGIATDQVSLPDLGENIKAVAQGNTLCSPRVASILFATIADRKRQNVRGRNSNRARITKREREIVALVEQGLTNKAIASQLCIQVQTVKNHVHNILEKLELSRRTQVARYARSVGWVNPSTSTRPSTFQSTTNN